MNDRVDAGKTRLARRAALELARSAARLVVSRGRSVLEFDMQRDPPDDETLARAILGPTGNLRAPTIRRGTTLLVGFNEQAYATLLARRRG